ncbi:MAG TPA: ATP-binding cassette domain-containing protein, partial [Chloroflexota bacterium]|nr:ATP-binding cassette domain-containing protein [Chloroflexota bacterium]
MLRATNLHKRYGRVRALEGLSLSVPRGAIYGLIGQNGAGKTTSIRILATLALPDQGGVEVDGIDAL